MHSSLFRRVLVAASLAAALTVIELAPVAVAAPAAPSNLTPASTDVSGSPVLAWTRVPTAAKYEVQVSANDSFASTLYTVRTDNRRATPTVNLPLGTEVFWRVRGLTTSSVPGAWSTASFTTSAQAGPQLQSPPDGESLQQPNQPPLLTWDVVPGAVGYTVEVDTDDMFVQPTVSAVASTSFLVDDPGPAQTYYWRVKATYTGGYSSDYSETRSFNVLALPAPELVSPDDSSTTQVQDSVLDWAPVAGAVTYEVRVSTDDQFNTIVHSAIVKSTRYARPDSLNNDQYWWGVRAIDVNGNKSPWSTSLNQFQRIWLDRPELIYPADGSAVSDSLYFEWSPVQLASDYTLEVAPDASFSPGTVTTCATKATTYAAGRFSGACTALVEGTYYWRVRPLDSPAQINGIRSEVHSFYFDPGYVTQLPLELDESGAAPVPTLSWEAYPGAEKYKITVKKSNNSTVATATTYSLSWSPTGTSRLDPEDGPFHWSVQGLGADGLKTTVLLDIAQPRFDVSAVPANADTPLTPTSPEDVHGVRFPALSWQPEPGAAYYKVMVGPTGGTGFFALGDKFPYPAATDDTAQFLVPGDYQWYAESYASNGTPLGMGPLGYFTVDQLDSIPELAVSLTGSGLQDADTRCSLALEPAPAGQPICSSLQQTPVFGWDRVDGAGYYMIQLSRDREMTNLIGDPILSANSMATLPTLLADSQAGTAYFWAVWPCKTKEVCAPEPENATNAFDKRSNPVSGLTEQEHESTDPLPAHGPDSGTALPEFADEVVLSWDDYLATNQQGNELDVTGLVSTLEAKTYNVEISTDPNFNTKIVSQLGLDQTSFTPYADTLPEGPLYWRVQAVDSSNNKMAWSLARDIGDATQGIRKRSAAPVLVAPIDNSKVSGAPAFVWEAQNYAARYDLQVAANGDETFAKPIITKTSLKQATYVHIQSLDPAGSPYVWRVRRRDAGNLAGPWSTTLGQFSVKGSSPSLISPAPDARLSATDSLFTWSAVEGAQQYKFERRSEGSTSIAESARTVSLNWAPVIKLRDGKYEWRVTALDASGKTLGASSWRNALVDDTGPKVVAKAPTKPKRTSNLVIRFDEPVKNLTSKTVSIYQDGRGRKLSAAVKLNAARTTATINPAKVLKPRLYAVVLSPRITDAYGNKLTTYRWTFTVK